MTSPRPNPTANLANGRPLRGSLRLGRLFGMCTPQITLLPIGRIAYLDCGSSVVGMLTPENLGEYVAIRSALQARHLPA